MIEPATHPFGAKPSEPHWKRAARIAFLLGAGVAAGLLIASEWDAIVTTLAAVDPMLLACALLAAITNVVLTGISWRALLAEAPVHLDLRTSARIFFVGQIGKYLPGSVWSFLASGELGQRAGLPRLTAMSSLGLALLIGIGSGVVVALATIPQSLGLAPDGPLVWFVAAAGFAVAFLPKTSAALFRLAGIDFPIPLSALILSGATAILAWLVAGIQLLLLAWAVDVSLDWSALPELTGAYAFAWIAGFLVFFAPAGLGAREGGLLAMLSLTMGLAEASAVVLLSRLAVTLADFACAGLAMLAGRPQAAATKAARPHQG